MSHAVCCPNSPQVSRLFTLTDVTNKTRDATKMKNPLYLPLVTSFPSVDSLVIETDNPGQWNVDLMTTTSIEVASDLRSDYDPVIPGLVNEFGQCSVSGRVPQNRQLMTTSPSDKFDMEKHAILGVARDIQRWERSTSIY